MHVCSGACDHAAPLAVVAIRKELLPTEDAFARDLARGLDAYAEEVIAQGVAEFGPEAAEPLREVWEASSRKAMARVAAAEATRRGWSVGANELLLDNPWAVEWVRANGGKFVTNITEATRETIRLTTERGFLEHLTAREQGRMLRSVVTLNSRQLRAVEFMLQEALDAGQDEARAVQRATSYASRLLAQRALTIARNEIIRAEAGGLEASWIHGRERGWLLPTSKKKWIASVQSRRTCPFCRDMNGATAPLGGTFKQNGREAESPPGHSRCRCGMGLVTF